MGLNPECRRVIRRSKADEEKHFREMNEKATLDVEKVEAIDMK